MIMIFTLVFIWMKIVFLITVDILVLIRIEILPGNVSVLSAHTRQHRCTVDQKLVWISIYNPKLFGTITHLITAVSVLTLLIARVNIPLLAFVSIWERFIISWHNFEKMNLMVCIKRIRNWKYITYAGAWIIGHLLSHWTRAGTTLGKES